MYYVGLDVHVNKSCLCILDDHGRQVKQKTIHGPWAELFKALRQIDAPFDICYEASCGYGHLHDHLQKIASRVAVAHPGHLRLIFRSKRKNDRVDAQKLAKLLYLDEVPGVYVPAIDIRDWRAMIEQRTRTVHKRVRTKNNIRALLRAVGLAPGPRIKKLWTKAGRLWLHQLDELTDNDRFRLDMLVDELEHFDQQIKRIESHLQRISQKHPGVDLLLTTPGVGQRTAEAMVACIDRPSRFTHNKTIGAYLGLVPSQDQSGSTNRLGHITRQGPATLRKLLTEAAWQGIRQSPDIRRYYERICRGDDGRKKIAIVATAHYLARVLLAMLKTGEAWRATPAGG
jgi:transposase